MELIVDDMIFEMVDETTYSYRLGVEESVVKKKNDWWEAFYRFGTYIGVGRGRTPEEAVKRAKMVVELFNKKFPEFRCLLPAGPGKYTGKFFNGEKWEERVFDESEILS